MVKVLGLTCCVGLVIWSCRCVLRALCLNVRRWLTVVMASVMSWVGFNHCFIPVLQQIMSVVGSVLLLLTPVLSVPSCMTVPNLYQFNG